jgi:hypothetical protein
MQYVPKFKKQRGFETCMSNEEQSAVAAQSASHSARGRQSAFESSWYSGS